MQGAGREQVEIGHQSTEAREMLDPAHQCLMRRIVFINHRRAFLRPVVDDQIDSIAAEPRVIASFGCRGRGWRTLGCCRLRQEIVDVFLDVALDRVEIGGHRRQVAVVGAQLVDQMTDGKPGDLTVQLSKRFAVLALPLRHLPHNLFEFTLNRFELMLDTVALVCGQFFESLRRQHLAVVLGRHRNPGRRPQQRDALRLGPLLQIAESLFAAFFELLVDNLTPRAVIIPLKGGGQRRAQLLDEPLHRHFELDAAPGRQRQAAWFLRVGEIVDVAPVGRRRFALCVAAQQLVDQRLAPGAAGAERKDIVPLAAHANGKPHCLDGSLLTDQPRHVGQFGAQIEWQILGVTASVQQFGWQWHSQFEAGRSRNRQAVARPADIVHRCVPLSDPAS